MNRDEAKTILLNAAWLGTNETREKTEEAARMAVDALSQQEANMTLEEFVNKVCSDDPKPASVYVFYARDSAEEWMHGGRGFEQVATIQSDYVMDQTFKREFCEEKVSHIFAYGKDAFVVVIGDYRK